MKTWTAGAAGADTNLHELLTRRADRAGPGISVASAAVRGEATGSARSFQGDAISVAKRDLRAGEVLDGEGGYTVRGVLAPAAASPARRTLPIGLAAGVALRRRLENTARFR